MVLVLCGGRRMREPFAGMPRIKHPMRSILTESDKKKYIKQLRRQLIEAKCFCLLQIFISLPIIAYVCGLPVLKDIRITAMTIYLAVVLIFTQTFVGFIIGYNFKNAIFPRKISTKICYYTASLATCFVCVLGYSDVSQVLTKNPDTDTNHYLGFFIMTVIQWFCLMIGTKLEYEQTADVSITSNQIQQSAGELIIVVPEPSREVSTDPDLPPSYDLVMKKPPSYSTLEQNMK